MILPLSAMKNGSVIFLKKKLPVSHTTTWKEWAERISRLE